MIKRVNEMIIKDILRHKDEKIGSIHRRMKNLYQELGPDTSDSIFQTAALPAIKSDGMPGAKGSHSDIGDVLVSIRKQSFEYEKEIRSMMWELVEQEDMVKRVWACFNALEDPHYTILYQIYVDNQKYQTVEDEYDLSHKTFEKKRQEGIGQIMRYYESNSSVAELMHKHLKNTAGIKGRSMKKKNKNKGTGYEQICFADVLEKRNNGN